MKAIGSTDKFSRAILAHLFCPHCALDPPHSSGYASGLPPQSARKIYAKLRVYFISDSYISISCVMRMDMESRVG